MGIRDLSQVLIFEAPYPPNHLPTPAFYHFCPRLKPHFYENRGSLLFLMTEDRYFKDQLSSFQGRCSSLHKVTGSNTAHRDSDPPCFWLWCQPTSTALPVASCKSQRAEPSCLGRVENFENSQLAKQKVEGGRVVKARDEVLPWKSTPQVPRQQIIQPICSLAAQQLSIKPPKLLLTHNSYIS